MVLFHETPHEKVRVFVDFNGTQVRPRAFFWGGHRYDIHKVHLVYQRRSGDRLDWCFACSDQGNAFTLRYNPQNLEWILDEVQGQ